jgi:hypothetical protein
LAKTGTTAVTPRKPAFITARFDGLLVCLADDGTIWIQKRAGMASPGTYHYDWEQVRNLPQPEPKPVEE